METLEEEIAKYCYHLSWGPYAGCVCGLPKNHEGSHVCAAKECEETWPEHDATLCDDCIKDEWCPYQVNHEHHI